MTWKVFFVYVPLAAYALTVLTFVLPLRAKIRTKVLWALALLPAFGKFAGFYLIDRHVFDPSLPEAVLWTWDWLFASALILWALSLLTVCFRFKAKVWLLPALAGCGAAWGIWSGVRTPVVREIELASADLPEPLDGYRIVHLSDVHVSSAARRWRTQRVVDLVNAQQPDLICLTGDYADGSPAKIFPEALPLAELRARDGVLACTGNHEYSFDFAGWMKAYGEQAKNIRFLTNACAFPRPGLAVAGVPDWRGTVPVKRDQPPDPHAAFAAATNGEFRILLQHRPTTARENVRDLGVALQLSGHTHGGIAPLVNRLVEWENGGFSRGLYRLGRSYLHVSPGAGQWVGCALRFFNPPEITVLKLMQKQ